MSSVAQKVNQYRSVAILLLTIDQELSAEVLKNMREESVDRLTWAMRELQESPVDAEVISGVYREAFRRLRDYDAGLGDVAGTIETLFRKAFGKEAEDLSTRASGDVLVKKPFAMFESLPADDLANLLVEEHPQIAAVFLAHLDRAKAASVLQHMPEDRHHDLLRRVATLDRTPPEVVQGVLDVLSKKVKDLGLTTLRAEPTAWIKAAAEILNNLGGGEKRILEEIAEDEEGLAEAIREEMFTFDDLAKLPRKAMQRVLTEVDTRALAMSLKAASTEVEEAIFGNLSKRAAGMVAEERDSLGPTPLSEVLEAQQEILTVVRDLMDKGEITAGVGGGDELV